MIASLVYAAAVLPLRTATFKHTGTVVSSMLIRSLSAQERRMQQTVQTIIPDLIEQHYQRLLDRWLAAQKRMGSAGGQIAEDRLADQSRLCARRQMPRRTRRYGSS